MDDLDADHCNDAVNSLSTCRMDDLDADHCNDSVNSLFPVGWMTLMLITVMILSTACFR